MCTSSLRKRKHKPAILTETDKNNTSNNQAQPHLSSACCLDIFHSSKVSDVTAAGVAIIKSNYMQRKRFRKQTLTFSHSHTNSILHSHTVNSTHIVVREGSRFFLSPQHGCHVTNTGDRQKPLYSHSSTSKSALCGCRGERDKSTEG